MSRRGKHRPHTGISLFAFLDVLICTMGALIILLMVLMRQASAEAETIVDQHVATTPAIDEQALKEQIEDAEWRRQLLEQQRLAKAQELSDQRLELAHLEDHIRRLQDRWKDLQEQANQLLGQDANKQASREKIAAEMAAVAADIAKSKQELDIARQLAASKPRSFSIIPYDGPNGTSRRPIYIECSGDAVTIQPEGVALDARDFEGPLGPGNPLDACLRAVREYLARNPQTAAQGGEPYPLLIVKPDGVVGYAAARAAMKSWEDEFGYELIEADTKLAYPPPDPTLKLLLERAIVDSRRRQEILAAAAPSRYRGTATGAGMRASPHGGFQDLMPDDGYGEAGGASGGGGPGNGSGGTRRSLGNRNDGIGRGDGDGFNEGYAGDASTGRGSEGFGDGTGPRSPGSGTAGRNFGGGRQDGPGGSGDGNYQGRETQGGQSGQPGRNGGNNNQPGVAQQGQPGGQRGGQQNGQAGGQPGGQRGGQQSGAAGGQAGGQSGGQPGGQPGGVPGGTAASGSTAPPNPNAKPIANKRGANWGLPNYQPKSTGITRPIRIRVTPDELMLIPERGGKRGTQVVPVEGSMVRATEELVSAVWDEVDDWGIAVAGGYWKPVLSIETAPGAEARVAELEALLDGSGLDVRRKLK